MQNQANKFKKCNATRKVWLNWQVNIRVQVFWGSLICYEESVRKSIPKVENIIFFLKELY